MKDVAETPNSPSLLMVKGFDERDCPAGALTYDEVVGSARFSSTVIRRPSGLGRRSREGRDCIMKRVVLSIAAIGLAGVLGASNAEEVPTGLYGSLSNASEATRTISIGPGTKHVNVTQGDVVKFVVGSREFTYRFDNVSTRTFDLQRVAPAGILDHSVTAYVAISPDLKGGP
jgi:hypothetical protein